jgi:hypothetical protein
MENKTADQILAYAVRCNNLAKTMHKEGDAAWVTVPLKSSTSHQEAEDMKAALISPEELTILDTMGVLMMSHCKVTFQIR